MEFNPKKPCGTFQKSKDRYTRSQLMAMAKQVPIAGCATMTMDELCAALRKKHAVIHPSVAQAPTQAPTPTKEKCLIDMNRPCGKNTTAKNKYKLPELKKLWKQECKDLPEFKGKKPTTIVEYCNLLKKRYSDVKFVAIGRLPEKVVETFKAWINKFSHIPVTTSTIARFVEVEMYNVRAYGPSAQIIRALSSPNPPTMTKTFTLDRLDTSYFKPPFDSFKAKTDSTYVFNRNVDRFPKEWLRKQTEYIFSLSPNNKIRLLCYTHAGDKICNSFILGTFDIAKIKGKNKFSEDFGTYLFPLALDMYLHTRRFPTVEKWLETGVFTTSPSPFSSTLVMAKVFFKSIKEESFADAYSSILFFLENEWDKLDKKMWYLWAGEYILHLNAIFDGVPPVPPEGLFTYRGVTDAAYVQANRKNVFVNETFMSTSPDLHAALTFKSKTGPCCLFSIQVLPGSKCLLPASLTYYNSELELLFAPGRQLFITKNQFKASNGNVQVTRFSLMN